MKARVRHGNLQLLSLCFRYPPVGPSTFLEEQLKALRFVVIAFFHGAAVLF